jgi:hypothetical protein
MVIMSADLERNYLMGFWTVDVASSEKDVKLLGGL